MPDQHTNVGPLLATLEATPSPAGKVAMFQAIVAFLGSALPRLRHEDRVDYTNADLAPVTHCVVMAQGQMLLVRRSSRVSHHPRVWAGITGYVDTLRPLPEVVEEELAEEAGIGPGDIAEMAFAAPYTAQDDDAKTTWLVLPVRVVLARTPTLRMNWENTDHQWTDPGRLAGLDVLPGLDRVVRAASSATLDRGDLEGRGQ